MATVEDDFIEITLHRGAKDGLGFNIRGGRDMPHIPEDPGIFVTKIRENGSAAMDGRLSEGDKIVEINGQSLEDLTHRVAVGYFQTAGDTVSLKIQKDAERKIVEATYSKVNPKRIKSKESIIVGVGAIVLLGYVLYRHREGIKDLFSNVWHSLPTGRTLYSHSSVRQPGF